MDDDRNVIHIIGGDEADNQDDKPVASIGCDYGEGSGATANLTYGGDGAMLSESVKIPAFGSSSLVVLENDRSYKLRYCRQYHTEAGCPFGDNCFYIHDEEAKTRESLAIIVGPGSSGGYRNAAATGNDVGLAAPPSLAPMPARLLAATATGNDGGPAAPPPLAPLPARPPAARATTAPPLAALPLAQTVPNSRMKPLNWRTKICCRWERFGYCQYGSRCFFAHGEAELQRSGGGPVARDANPNSQRVMVPNLAAASGSSAAHAITASASSAAHAVTASVSSAAHAVTASVSSAAHAGGSGQVSGAVQRPIPSWKVPKKINRIYGDWIDDDE